MDPVINQYRRVNQLADTGAPSHGSSDVRKALQQVNVIQNGVTESLRIIWKLRPRVREDFPKVR